MGGNKKRRHGGASIAVNDAPQMQIGEVGYEFRKLFNQGWFQGKVVKIRPGAAGGRDRRVVYSVSTNDHHTKTHHLTLILAHPGWRPGRPLPGRFTGIEYERYKSKESS